jgi:hypothetical protein
MSSVSPIDRDETFPQDALTAQDRVDSAKLQTQVGNIKDKINTVVAALDRLTRDDDSLADGHVRLRMMHRELITVLAASSDWQVKDMVDVCAVSNCTTSGPNTIDDILLTDGMRILLTAQTTPAENGIWVVNTGGTWTRAADADANGDLDLAFVSVTSGSQQLGSSWLCMTTGTVIGTTATEWTLVFAGQNLQVEPALWATSRRLMVRAVSVSNLNIASPGATIDGVTMATGDRVLLAGQSAGSQNGLWSFNGAAVPLTRPPDYPPTGTVQAFTDLEVPVRDGSTYAGVVFRCSTAGTITIDSTATVWSEYSRVSVVATIAALKALTVRPAIVQVNGYYAAGDGGGGTFRWNASDTTADNGGTIIIPDSGGTGRWNRVNTQTVDVRAFGAVGDGVTVDTSAINAAINSGAKEILFTGGTYLINASLAPLSGQTLRGVGPGGGASFPAAKITCATAEVSLISATSKSGIQVRDLWLHSTVASTTTSSNGVALTSCTQCKVQNVRVSGVSWGGVYLDSCTDCEVAHCYMTGWTGTIQDSADVTLYRTCTTCRVEFNTLEGGGWHGVLCQDPGGSLTPTKNIIAHNRIGAHTAYGIISYNVTAANSHTQIIGNQIEGITGANPSGSGGAGIYIQSAGGCIITGNSIRNCCTSTSNQTLTPAGIGINNINSASGLIPITISGNTISDMGGGNNNAIVIAHINVSSSTAGATITGNTMRQASGLGAAASTSMYLNASSNLNVAGNSIFVDSTIGSSVAIFSYANGTDISNLTFANNAITGCSFAGIRFDTDAAYSQTNVVIVGNQHSGGSSACISYRLTRLIQATMTGNTANAVTTNALTVSSCTQLRISGNTLKTSGTLSFVTSGTCTESYFDKTNFVGNSYTFIQNAATGLIVEYLGNAIPGASNWAVGDRVEQSVPVVGNPKGWRCTVAGAPGTWVSEGNL